MAQASPSSPIRIDLPLADAAARVAQAARDDRLVLFIGAGVSRNAGYPLWKQLLNPVAQTLGGWDALEGMSLPQVAQAYEHHCGTREPLRDLLQESLGCYKPPSPVHHALAGLRARLLVTTNYDNLLKSTFPQARLAASPGSAARLRKDELGILHLHGHFDFLEEGHDGLILTEDDYAQVGEIKKPFFERLRPHWQDSLILFLGYGAGDPDVAYASRTVRAIYGETFARRHLALDLSGNKEALLRTYWTPFCADVVQGAGLDGGDPGAKLLTFIQACVLAMEPITPQPTVPQSTLASQVLSSTSPASVVCATAVSNDAAAATLQAQASSATPIGLPLAGELKLGLAPFVFMPPNDVPLDLEEDAFVGRKALMQSMEWELCEGKQIGVWGFGGGGGIGKSALATRIVNRLSRRRTHKDGYLWLRVGECSFAESMGTVWEKLGGSPEEFRPEYPERMRDRLRQVLAGRQMLVVLDNCDQPDRVPPLLELFNGQAVLVTARKEASHGKWHRLDFLTPEESRELLRQLHPPLAPLPDAELDELAVARFAGLPLALRLAGLWLHKTQRSIGDYLKRLDRYGLDALHDNNAAGDARAQDLRACFAVSYEQLDAAGQRLFVIASLFGGQDFPEDLLGKLCVLVELGAEETPDAVAVERVVAAVDSVVDALVEANILARSAPGRLAMHALLRDYGRELLASRDDLANLDVGLLAGLLGQAVRDAPSFALAELSLVEDTVLRAAISGAAAAAFDLLAKADNLWMHGAKQSNRVRAWQALLGASGLLAEQQRQVLMQLGDALQRQGSNAQARTVLRRALQVGLAAQDDHCIVRCRYLLSGVDADQADLKALPDTLRRAFRARNHRAVWDACDLACRTLADRLGQNMVPVQHYRVALAASLNFNFNFVLSCMNLAKASVQQGNGAARKLEQAHQTIADKRLMELESAYHRDVAGLQLWQDNYSLAQQALTASFASATRHSQLQDEACSHCTAAQLALAQDDANRARAAAEQAIGFADHYGDSGLLLAADLLACEARLLTGEAVGPLSADMMRLQQMARQRADLYCVMEAELLLASLELASGVPVAQQAACQRVARVDKTVAGLTSNSLDGCRLRRRLDKRMDAAQVARVAQLAQSEATPIFDLRPDWQVAATHLPQTKVGKDGMNLLHVSGGFYRIAPQGITWSAENSAQAALWLPDFYIDEHPITCAQYAAFCAATHTSPPPSWPQGICPPDWQLRPVTDVTVVQAQAYAAWVGRCLPVREEWLAAACGPDGSRFPWGDDPEAVDVSAPALPLPDMSIHPLTVFDEAWFADLVDGSLSLSLEEKLRVVNAVPVLSQFQIDELHKVWEDELLEYEKLEPTEGDAIQILREKRAAMRCFYAGVAPRDVASVPNDASVFGVRDMCGLVREWLDPGAFPDKPQTVGVLAGSTLRNVKLADLPEVVVFKGKIHSDPSIGFRCVLPIGIDLVAHNAAPQKTEVASAPD